MRTKQDQRQRRHTRTRCRFSPGKPRMIVFRSLKHIYIQLLDPKTGTVITSASDVKMKKEKKTKKEIAREVGKTLAKKALEKNITTCVFDRAGYQYHGRVKELADGAREGGLQF